MEFTQEQQEHIDKMIGSAVETATSKAVKDALNEAQSKFDEETKGLRDNKEQILNEKKELEKKLAGDDADSLKAFHQTEIEKLTQSYDEKLSGLTEQINGFKTKEVDSIKDKLANTFVSDNVVNDPFSRRSMLSEYKKRIDVREGKQVVLDGEGNISALTIEDLSNEFKNDELYAGHIIGTKAKSGGATGGGTGGTGSNASAADILYGNK